MAQTELALSRDEHIVHDFGGQDVSRVGVTDKKRGCLRMHREE